MSRARFATLILLAAPAFARCSLLGYDDFALASCTESTQCDALNVSRRIATDACMRYQCDTQAQRCVLRVRDGDGDGDPSPACGGRDCDDASPTVFGGPTPAPERCDGIDNNCNRVIDEGGIVPRAPSDAVTGLSTLDAIGYSRGANGRLGLSYQTSGVASFAVLQGGGGAMALSLSHSTNGSDNLQMPAAIDGCRWRRADATMESVETCSFGEMAVDSALNDSDWLAVSVNRVGCTAGQIRIGYVPVGAERSAALVLRGPAARSNSYLGIDRDGAMADCTGASRMAGPRGAARPAIATLQRPAPAIPQALTAWLGDAASRAECGGTAVNVEALGMWLESAASGGATVQWVNATNNALPQVLGQTRGGARPSITAWGDRGYFVGYGASDGGVALHFVPSLSDPPTFNPAGTSARPTAPMAPGAAFRMATGAADGVSVSVGAIRATGLELGVAWQQGCGAAGSSVWFSRVRFNAASPGTFMADAPVEVSTGMGASAPTIAYVSAGFVTPEFSRGGATATAETDGGWVIAWIDAAAGARRVLARRVSELDGALIDEAAFDLTHRPAGDAPVGPSRPMLYSAATQGLLRYAYHDATRNSLVGADLLCAPGAAAP